MVEMRWVVRRPDEGFSRMAGIKDNVGMDRILQYRERTEKYPDFWVQGQNPPLVVSWTEWQDVPVVDGTTV